MHNFHKQQNLFMKIFNPFNPFMHNVVKWPNILYVWPFYNMHERVKVNVFHDTGSNQLF